MDSNLTMTPRALKDSSSFKYAISIDIGGTKIAAAIVRSDVAILSLRQVRTPQNPDPNVIFNAVSECVILAMQESGINVAGVVGLGCGCAGPMQWPEGVVSATKIPAWRNFPLKRRLEEAFPGVPVLVHNDGIALSVGEHWAGKAAGSHNMLAITVSTGIGGGLVLNDRIFHGKSGNAGHFGHIVVDRNGPTCGCGGHGCLEAIASGPASVLWAQAQGWFPGQGMSLDGVGLASSAELGDKVACRALNRAGTAIGQAIASQAAMLDLDCVVVAGGFSRSGSHFWDPLLETFSKHTMMDFARRTRIERSDMAPNAGLIGAAGFVLFPERYGWSTR